MENDLKIIKKKITKDWQQAFPELVKFSKNNYYKIIGPALVGLEFVHSPITKKYSPHFVIYSLWGNREGRDLKACLSYPIILKPFYNKSGQEISIFLIEHDNKFLGALNAVKQQLPFLMEGNVHLKDMLSVFDEMSKAPPLSAAPNSYLQASLLESKLEMILCLKVSEKIVEGIYNQIIERKWDLKHFALWGVSFERWLINIKNKIDYPDEILQQLKKNKEDKKLIRLKNSEINI